MKTYISRLMGVAGVFLMPLILCNQVHALSWEQSSDVHTIIIVKPGTDFGDSHRGRLPDGNGESGKKLYFDRESLRSSENDRHVKDDTQVAVVPEPETYAMMLAGLGLLIITLRRRDN